MIKNFFLNTLIIFISFVFCTISAELLIRIFDPQDLIYYNNDLWVDDHSGLGHKHKSNLITKINTGGAGLVNYRTDENGFRINLNDSKPNKIDKKILILGDSFIEAIQIENKDSIPELLKKNLKDNDGLEIKYYNTAVAGYDLNHYYLISKRELAKREYDLGIIFLSGTDIEPTQIKESFSPWSYTYPSRFQRIEKINKNEIIDKILYPINDFFEVRSHLFLFLKYRLKNLLAKHGLTYSTISSIFYTDERNTIEIDNVMNLSNMIKEEFENKNVPVFFVFLPLIYQVEENTLKQFMNNFNIDENKIDIELPNKILRKKFIENDIIFFDLLEHMKKSKNESLKFYEPIDKHFNANGHKVVSEYLYSKVRDFLN